MQSWVMEKENSQGTKSVKEGGNEMTFFFFFLVFAQNSHKVREEQIW
jgi:hypothetical protein